MKIDCVALIFVDFQQMSGDLSGEAMSRSIVESVSNQIAKGITTKCILYKILHLLMYTESTDASHHPLNSHLSQVSFVHKFFSLRK